MKELLPDRYTSHHSTPKQRGAAYSTSFYNLLLLFIKNKNATRSFQHSLCYALRGSIHSIIQYTRKREGGNTLYKKSTTRLLYVSALETSVVSNPSLPPLFIGAFRRNRVVKVIASITEGSQESVRALVLHYSARYSPLKCLKSRNPYSVWSSRLEL